MKRNALLPSAMRSRAEFLRRTVTVAHGISKINFCTGLFLSTTEAARKAIDENGGRMQLPGVLGVIHKRAREEMAHLFEVYHTQPLALENIAHK